MIRYLSRGIVTRYLSTSVDKVSPVENRSVRDSNNQDYEVIRSPAACDIEDILNKKHHISVNDGASKGLFGQQYRDLQDTFTSVTKTCDNLLSQLETCDTDETLDLVDDIVRHVVSLSDMAIFLAQSTSDRQREGYEVLKQTEDYINKLNNNTVVLCALKKLVTDTVAWEQMSSEARRAVLMLLVDCKHNGLDKPLDKRNEIQKLIKEVGLEGVLFVKESIVPVRIPIEKCPNTLLSLPSKDSNIVLSDWCDSSTSDAIREAAWINYYKQNPRQEAVLHNLLGKRHKLAQATGYENYSERALQGSMAGSPAEVQEFVTELHEQIRPCAREETYEMEKFKYHGSKFWYNRGFMAVGEVVVFPWDTKFLAEDMRKLWIKQETRVYPSLPDYLSVGSVVEQIGVWLEDSIGVTLVAERPLAGELWHPDVIKLAVEHEKEGLIGLLYLDFYTTDKKRAPPCHHVIRSRTDKQLPISVIECSYIPGNGYRPPYLNMNSLEKLFRELGSAIHVMLNRSVYYQTSTNYLSPDVKLISGYLLQNLSRNPTVLNHVMKHHTRTNVKPRVNPIAILAMSNAQNLIRSHEIEQQLLLSALDQTLHTEWPFTDGRSSTEVYARHCEEYTHLPYIEDTAPHLRFTQLYTQGGHVYSHLWCKAIANLLYEELFVIDPFSRHAGEYFREHFLKHGAGMRPREMVEYLTGTKLTADRLASALVKPVEGSQHYGPGFAVIGNKGGKQWWHREISSPDSALLSRLSATHPDLVAPSGALKVPPPFDRERVNKLREQASSSPIQISEN